jgi:GNAT superfamily N-acetyltransferase
MFRLQQTRLSHIREISACHTKCFPKSLSSKLGLRYLDSSFRWFLAADNRFLFHAEFQNEVIGYCGGFRSLFPGDGSASGILQFSMGEAVRGVLLKPYLLFHPELIKRYPLILKNIKRRVFKNKKFIPPESSKCAAPTIGLVVIGVLPEYRGKGCFELLMQQFEAECKKREAEKMILSVKASNARAIAAYKKVGWGVASQSKKGVEMFKIII